VIEQLPNFVNNGNSRGRNDNFGQQGNQVEKEDSDDKHHYGENDLVDSDLVHGKSPSKRCMPISITHSRAKRRDICYSSGKVEKEAHYVFKATLGHLRRCHYRDYSHDYGIGITR
jgi:hypothetical protein